LVMDSSFSAGGIYRALGRDRQPLDLPVLSF